MPRRVNTVALQYNRANSSRRNWGEETPEPLLRRSGNRAPRGRRFLRRLMLVAILIGVLYWAAKSVIDLFSPRGPTPYFTSASQLEGVTLLPVLPPVSAATLSHTVAGGETWATIMAAYGFSIQQAQSADEALKSLARTEEVSPQIGIGQRLDFEFAPSGALQRIVTQRGPEYRIELLLSSDGKFHATLQKTPKRDEERVLLGLISKEHTSFARAAQAAGVSYELVDDLVDLFSDRIRFRQDFRAGDRFTVVFNETMVGESQAGLGAILAARLDVNGAEHVAIRYVGSDGKARYFDGEGKLLGNTFLRYPLKFSRISSEFSKSRFHPVLKRSRPHNGVDFAAPHGTPVRSVSKGTVTFAGRKGGNGLMVSIKHSERYQTVYCHLSKIDPAVRRGKSVARGQVIGAVGSTGLATGPHLHFGFFDNGKYVDPLKVKLPTVDNLGKGLKINESYLQLVKYTLGRYQKFELANMHPTAPQ